MQWIIIRNRLNINIYSQRQFSSHTSHVGVNVSVNVGLCDQSQSEVSLRLHPHSVLLLETQIRFVAVGRANFLNSPKADWSVAASGCCIYIYIYIFIFVFTIPRCEDHQFHLQFGSEESELKKSEWLFPTTDSRTHRL